MKKCLILICVIFCSMMWLIGCSKTVTAEPGDTVACTVFSGKSSDTYVLNGSLTLDFSGDAAAQTTFTRFDLEYELSAPVRCSVTYTVKNSPYTEEFYLSETQSSFSQLIDSFLYDGKAEALQTITIEPLKEGECTLKLTGGALVLQQVPDTVLTIENDRFLLGVSLTMGGGISCLKDKQSPREDIANLLNEHDTGRMIQQSYYGVASWPEYKNGTYNGNTWSYNPVQGGDQFGNCSKLVAVSVTEDSVTVVSRPMDWALDGVLTYAYYTNTYTLQEDVIRVDNTILDFSGYPNPVTSQELPAFYTVSALGNFVYYEGEKPWTGDTLTYKRDLGFWANDPNCSMSLSPDNSETWCAWVDDNDYGVGLYTPNVEWLKAGRYRYDGDTRSTADSTNYVAPICSLALTPYEPISYSYLISAGTVEELRASFTEKKDFAANEDLRQTMSQEYDFTAVSFEKEEDLVFLSDPYQSSVSYENCCAVLTYTGGEVADPRVSLFYSRNGTELYAEKYPYLVLTYRTGEQNSAAAGSLELFLCTDRLREAQAGYSVRSALETDGMFHTLVFPLEKQSFWSGRINLIRMDYFCSAKEGDTLYLYSACLAENEAAAQELAAAQLEAVQKTLE